MACAAALKNIQILQEEKLVQNSADMGEYFLEGLKILEKHPTVGEARGTGLWLALDFTSDKKTRAAFPIANVSNIIARAKDRGLLVKTMGAALEIAPPLIINKEDIDLTVEILDLCISEEENEMGM